MYLEIQAYHRFPCFYTGCKVCVSPHTCFHKRQLLTTKVRHTKRTGNTFLGFINFQQYLCSQTKFTFFATQNPFNRNFLNTRFSNLYNLRFQTFSKIPIPSQCNLSLSPENIKKPSGFLMFSGGGERVH